MGMRFILIRATPEQIERLPVGKDSLWDRLAGPLLSSFRGSDEDGDILLNALDEGKAPRLDIDKAWHGLHFLLTGSRSGGSFPAAFIGCGGEEVKGTHGDFGQVRLFKPEQTRELGNYLGSLTRERLYEAFDPPRMEELDIYPSIWDEGDKAFEYLWHYFEEMRALVAEMVDAGDGFVCRIE